MCLFTGCIKVKDSSTVLDRFTVSQHFPWESSLGIKAFMQHHAVWWESNGKQAWHILMQCILQKYQITFCDIYSAPNNYSYTHQLHGAWEQWEPEWKLSELNRKFWAAPWTWTWWCGAGAAAWLHFNPVCSPDTALDWKPKSLQNTVQPWMSF